MRFLVRCCFCQLFLSTFSFAEVSLYDGLVIHYKFDNLFSDSSQFLNHAVSSGALFETDRFGNLNSALSVTPTTGVYSQANIGIARNSSRTFSFWLKPQANAGNNSLFASLIGWGISGWSVGVGRLSSINYLPSNPPDGPFGGANFQFNGWYTDANVRMDPALLSDQWNQLAVVYENNVQNTKIYLNGIIQTENFNNNLESPYAVTTLDTIDTALRINAEVHGPGFQGIYGLYDDVRIYNRALSPSEVSTLYATESVPEPSALSLFAIGLGGLAMMRRRRS